MNRSDIENKLLVLATHAWDEEIRWHDMNAWANNFTGDVFAQDEEQLYALFMLTRFMYFSKRLIREMLRVLYEDHFRSPLIQRIRRNNKDTKDIQLLNGLFEKELATTRFVGVGNPAESGAHLLYFFRQVNYLSKSLFVDIGAAFTPVLNPISNEIEMVARDQSITRYVFFDDLVGSGDQVELYLKTTLAQIRKSNKKLELRFMSLFSTSKGFSKLSDTDMFGERVSCLFELDSTYKAFGNDSRYFKHSPSWFNQNELEQICSSYGRKIYPRSPLGHRSNQLLLGFSHNTPDNTLPVLWAEGHVTPWNPVCVRFEKKY
ncbi:phosphoribosyltransferase-like protein [Methylovorus mays]|uniref:phosphoribosyltransferase-like protein n=1 Tax=Methylovorus mays TaxID=184077 RepID=UPI001E31CEE2|nr:hypothetical protein [Methylovorus mays]MCB5206703.1 hypothetical protein [Methylovorus mays]